MQGQVRAASRRPQPGGGCDRGRLREQARTAAPSVLRAQEPGAGLGPGREPAGQPLQRSGPRALHEVPRARLQPPPHARTPAPAPAREKRTHVAADARATPVAGGTPIVPAEPRDARGAGPPFFLSACAERARPAAGRGRGRRKLAPSAGARCVRRRTPRAAAPGSARSPPASGRGLEGPGLNEERRPASPGPLAAAAVAAASALRKPCYPTPVEAAGGKALPCSVDVRDEQQISNAVEKAVERFGAIHTAAMDMLGGSGIESQCRKVEIIADAAYSIFKRPKSFTGNFIIDENILREEGIKNFDIYAIKPGHPLLPDFFLDEHPDIIIKKAESRDVIPELKEEKPQPPPKQRSGAVEETFRIVKDSLSDDIVKATQAVYQFELSGEDGGTWFLDLKSKGGNVGYGEPSNQADVVMSMSTDDFVKMFSGKLKPTMAFMSGKLKIKGNMALAIKLEKLMNQMNAKL
uniref:Hydroxysteroid dehydrogenase like 2 n=1 Tax=Canis lupus familiaris TaxID=9615 RepID=A0A8I3N4S2_CANLF